MQFSALRVFRSSQLSLAEIHRQLQPPAADIAKTQAIVDDIIRRVRTEGDGAVLELTQQFDWPEAALEKLTVTATEMDAAMRLMDEKLLQAMTVAAEHIRAFHQRQMPTDWFEEMEYGLQLGQRHTPVDSVACYVPSSRAPLPSSLLMSVIPAQVAGVPRIVVVGPCRQDGAMQPSVLAAAHLLGIDEIYKIGGAQAIAAMAIGTERFPKVDKIVGPGPIFSTLAKKSLFGEVGIDGLNGPSDITVIADGTVPAAWVATDLLSQAEHGGDSACFLITPDEAYANAIKQEIGDQLAVSSRAQFLTSSLAGHSAVIITRNLEEAAEMANLLAPEHLELAMANPQALLPAIRHAGAIFLGSHTPVPVGDFFAGPSHVLPTDGTARFASGLGVMDFLKRSSLIQASPDWLAKNKDMIVTLADTEGLPAHAETISRRV